MKAIAVKPGIPNTVHLTELPAPKVNDIANGRGVLVRVLRVGVDGTDKEINAAEYGQAPPGYDFLIIGHESFGQVEAVGPNVTEVKPGDYVVATVRRPGSSIYDLIGTNDMTTDDTYFERGINLRHGYMSEYYVDDAEFIVKIPQGLKEVGVLLEPTTVVEKGIAQAYEIQRRLKSLEAKTRRGYGRRNDRFARDARAASQGITGDDVWKDTEALFELRPDRSDRRDLSINRRTFDSRRRKEVWTV